MHNSVNPALFFMYWAMRLRVNKKSTTYPGYYLTVRKEVFNYLALKFKNCHRIQHEYTNETIDITSWYISQ